MFCVLSRARDKEKILSLTRSPTSDPRIPRSDANLKTWSSILMGAKNFFFVPRSWQDEKIFLYFFAELKNNCLSYSISLTYV